MATLIIVAVVIIMAALSVEVKASPVFDRANLKEERQILLEEARWNRYSKARRCGSKWSGIQEAAVDPVYFSQAPWAVTTIWLFYRVNLGRSILSTSEGRSRTICCATIPPSE